MNETSILAKSGEAWNLLMICCDHAVLICLGCVQGQEDPELGRVDKEVKPTSVTSHLLYLYYFSGLLAGRCCTI